MPLSSGHPGSISSSLPCETRFSRDEERPGGKARGMPLSEPGATRSYPPARDPNREAHGATGRTGIRLQLVSFRGGPTATSHAPETTSSSWFERESSLERVSYAASRFSILLER